MSPVCAPSRHVVFVERLVVLDNPAMRAAVLVEACVPNPVLATSIRAESLTAATRREALDGTPHSDLAPTSLGKESV